MAYLASTNSKYLDNKGTLWFNVKLPLKGCSLKELATFSIGKEEMDDLYQEAQQLLDDETTKFHGGLDRKNWYNQQFQKRGTVSDRIASAAVHLSGTDFMFYLDGFSFLFDTARNDSHNYEAALKALSAVWPKLLPARPLKRFAAQYFATLPPADKEGEAEEESKDQIGRKRILLYWYIEDVLKRTYGQFLTLAEGSLKDKIQQRREAWLNVAGKLLTSVAELRHVTVAMVVDKLGDPLSKISHKAYHLLLAMLSETSTTQATLLNEIEKVLFQKNCPIGTQKYCINVINQLVFNREERKLALKCVQTFLGLFKHLALEGSLDHSITDAIIVGLRRAFPFTGSDFSVLDPHVDALFVIANKAGNFHQRVSALMLVYQLVSKGYTKLEDRYYRAMYHLLLISPKQLPHSSQLSGFFASLYKCIRNDKDATRVAAFVHRLLQRCLFCNEAFVCASLLLVAEAVNCHSTVRKMIRGTNGNNTSAPKTIAAPIPAAPVGGRVSALAGGVDVLETLDEDEEEHFIDADLLPTTAGAVAKPVGTPAPVVAASPTTGRNSGAPANNKKQDEAAKKPYNPNSREPQYSNAHNECLWILAQLTKHVHPSVVKLAVLLLQGEDISFDTHPLDDMTMTNFLEMFVDGSESGTGGASGGVDATDAQGNALASKDTKGVAVFRRAVHVAHIPRLSDENFARLAPDQVDVSALFLHRFAYQRTLFMEGMQKQNLNKFWGLDVQEEEEQATARVKEGNAFDPAVARKEKKSNKKSETAGKKSSKKDAGEEMVYEGEAANDDDEAGFDETQFDYNPNEEEDDDFDWGDGDSGYGESEEDEEGDDDFSAVAARAVGRKRNQQSYASHRGDGEDDDGEEDFGGEGNGADAGDFDAMMSGHSTEKRVSKRRRLEDQWMSSREADSRGGYRNGGGGRSGGGGGGGGGFRGGRGGRGGGGGRGRGRY